MTRQRWIGLGVALVLTVGVWTIEKQIRGLNYKLKSQSNNFKKFKDASMTVLSENGSSMPYQLQNIPFGETQGIVLDVKNIPIQNVEAPYNASIIENGSEYLLFFRYDEIGKSQYPHPFFTRIGCAELDTNFNVTERGYRTINTHSDFSEDPRVLRKGSELFLIYNDLMPHVCNCRTMRIAGLDLEKAEVKYVTDLDLHIKTIEKNWTPFEYINEHNQSEIYFEYYINPHKILKLSNPEVPDMTHLIFPNNPCLQNLPWAIKWGELRGGTTPRLVDGQYLSFFHSMFRDRAGFPWYVMGAYTFEAKPPFRVTAISPYPILFKGIYDTPLCHTAPNVRCIFPGGFAIEERGDKQLLHVSCGENDCAIKIVTIDKEVLMKSLKKL